MNWIRKVIGQLTDIWRKWGLTQKVIFGAIVAGVILGVLLLFTVSAAPTSVPLLTRPIEDQALLDRIAIRLDQLNVSYQISGDQRILVDSQRTARRLRALLTREDLIPLDTDPWELFDMERWTQTDFERNINLQRAITRQLENHIEALDDVDAVSVNLVIPDTELFAEDQNPVTASVIITPKPGSDIRESRLKIEGIQKLIQFAIEGLTAENITITDRQSRILNDFADFESFDRLELTRRELKIEGEIEDGYMKAIFESLKEIYGQDRVQIINIDVALDASKRTQETEEFYPIDTVPDNPDTPFSERQFVLSIPRSTETIAEDYEGTGFNPEGPPGLEGQTPPAYRDLEGLVGRYSNEEERFNNEVNKRTIYEEKSPEIGRVTASVAIDGVWEWKYDEEGNLVVDPDGSISREYRPVSADELSNAEQLIRDAVGFDQTRGDSVSVRHIQFDRDEEQRQEDLQYRRAQQRRLLLIYGSLALIAAILIIAIIRLIARQLEHRRRLFEVELARQQEALRQASLEDEVGAVEMSVEERARLELQENAITMAREHPDNVARVLRTWMLED